MVRDKAGRIPGTPYRLSWPAIFGGMFAAGGVWLLLHAMGLSLGLSTIEPTDPSALRAGGIGGSIWVVLTSMISLFVGGFVTARSAGILGRSNAGLHGIVLWGVTTIFGTFILASFLASMARSAAELGMQTGRAAAAQQGAFMDMSEALGLDANDFLAPVNERLAEQGKAPIDAAQLQSALRDAVNTAVREQRFDRDVFESALAANTGLARKDVRELFGSADARVAALQQQLAERATGVARATGRMFWGLFALMTLSLLSSFLGAIFGVTRRQQELAQLTPPLPTAIPRAGEVYTS